MSLYCLLVRKVDRDEEIVVLGEPMKPSKDSQNWSRGVVRIINWTSVQFLVQIKFIHPMLKRVCHYYIALYIVYSPWEWLIEETDVKMKLSTQINTSASMFALTVSSRCSCHAIKSDVLVKQNFTYCVLTQGVLNFHSNHFAPQTKPFLGY